MLWIPPISYILYILVYGMYLCRYLKQTLTLSDFICRFFVACLHSPAAQWELHDVCFISQQLWKKVLYRIFGDCSSFADLISSFNVEAQREKTFQL